MRPIFLQRKSNMIEKYPELAVVGGIVLAFVILLGVIAPSAHEERKEKASIPCPPPRPGEELRVTGSADGKPFCMYYPVKGYGAAP